MIGTSENPNKSLEGIKTIQSVNEAKERCG